MAKRRYRILAPSAVTSANIAAGFMAMVAAADGRLYLSTKNGQVVCMGSDR